MKYHSPKDVLIYDNGGPERGGTLDRFIVCFPWDGHGCLVACVAMDKTPFHPQGFCQHSEALIGPHLGRRILYVDLNDDCARVVRQELAAYNADAFEPDNLDGDAQSALASAGFGTDEDYQSGERL